jgi:hypothetical protein
MLFFKRCVRVLRALPLAALTVAAQESPMVWRRDPSQGLERTCFQTSQEWTGKGNLRSDVAIVYGIDNRMTERIETWRDRGYIIHLMTGVSWGQYQDYLYGRFDGINHEDEAQTDRNGEKVSHGGDVYYMCPGTNFGKFLCVGVRRALDAGAEAIHLEEPEFWVRSGYSEGFKREWRAYYNEDWQPPHSSVDAQWRASKLKYHLYLRALQQVFDYVQDYNAKSGRKVRCYVPTHSLVSYAHWRIVSPESSLARLKGCDGYIAQVWTGTSRTPNQYRGMLKERTFETAFLEYGAMRNLVRSTGRRVWYLNDPIEDNPDHDWEDYRVNWESTLTASLLQPEVWRYEVAPWPERVFTGEYPRKAPPGVRQSMPPAYATELQTVMNALNDMDQKEVSWNCGTLGIGVVISDSLMFQRGDPEPGDPHLGNLYGLALPLVKRGIPVTPVQLENTPIPGYLDGFRLLLLTYEGQKPLTPEVHAPIADWVRRGGALVIVDDGKDAYNSVREWWNTGGLSLANPVLHLLEKLDLVADALPAESKPVAVGKGHVLLLRKNPSSLAKAADGDTQFVAAAKSAAEAAKIKWKETNHLLLRRGPYVAASGLDESIAGPPAQLKGRFINLFDPSLAARKTVSIDPATRHFLLDLDVFHPKNLGVIASACKTMETSRAPNRVSLVVEGVADTPAVVLMKCSKAPRSVTLEGKPIGSFTYSPEEYLLWIRFNNTSAPRTLSIGL